MDFQGFSARLGDKGILIVGDLMLDIFVYGDTKRLSPEAPVPVLLTDHETIMPGGAGNAAANLGALNIPAYLVGVIGHDAAGRTLTSALRAAAVDTAGLITDETRPTITKTRYVGPDGQIVRVDVEKTHSVSDAIAAQIVRAAQEKMPVCGAVIISDYAKGVLRPDVIQAVIDAARKHNIPVIVDPKGTDYTRYQGAFAVTPNRKELFDITGMTADSDDAVVTAARTLAVQAGLGHIVVKRSEDGISVVTEKDDPVHIKALATDVRDVSGAGDTVVATLAAALAAGATLADAARVANEAAAIVVAKPGTSVVRADEMDGAPSADFISPVMNDWSDAARRVRAWQSQGLKVGFTNGCFDILHFGHVNYLNAARARCDKLVVGLNHDESVRILKGPSRPVNDETARATVMAALGCVDMVIFFGATDKAQDNTPAAVIDAIRPDVFFKGGDYTADQLPEAKIVQSYGGVVDIMPLYEGYSTTATIEKMKNGKEKAA